MTDPMTPSGADFRPVSPELATVRLVAAAIWCGVPLLAFAVLALLVSPWFWTGAGVALAILLWLAWLLPRQVRALGFAETDEEFLVRRGIMFRSLNVIPYGRIQYVDVNEGPVARHFGIASITLHTASAETSGTIDGLPAEEAVRLRDMLARRGSAELAGL